MNTSLKARDCACPKIAQKKTLDRGRTILPLYSSFVKRFSKIIYIFITILKIYYACDIIIVRNIHLEDL